MRPTTSTAKRVLTRKKTVYILYLVTLTALIWSFFANRSKTGKALRVAVVKFLNILPAFLIMLIFISITLTLVPDTTISRYLGSDNKLMGILIASCLGSITLIPGFIAFPLCGLLLQKGVPYMTISAFTTTLMMVGVLTYPLEKEYLGTRITLLRNSISFIIAIIVAGVTGIFFGELF